MCECNMHYKKNNTAKLLSSKYIIYIWNTQVFEESSHKKLLSKDEKKFIRGM